ncbi:MAG: UPF0079 ATP-binding protein [Parcubacteria group bacterium Gr01-1014_33]|nr:MAG: UPF0079 ATP-binding protein [Parcubacteria group bacterium Gr01-1014_33]
MSMRTITTKTPTETKKIASLLAKTALHVSGPRPLVIALVGNLGVGKTAFAQGFAKGCGIKEKVRSPTFVLMKTYRIRKNVSSSLRQFARLIHIDCYRLNTPRELLHIGFAEVKRDQHAIILIEWADRIKKILPKDTAWIRFAHGQKINERSIAMETGIWERGRRGIRIRK